MVAEIGPDVPENISCFQIGIGVTECDGRRGATEIRIYDNDRELLTYESYAVLALYPWHACTARVTVLS